MQRKKLVAVFGKCQEISRKDIKSLCVKSFAQLSYSRSKIEGIGTPEKDPSITVELLHDIRIGSAEKTDETTAHTGTRAR